MKCLLQDLLIDLQSIKIKHVNVQYYMCFEVDIWVVI